MLMFPHNLGQWIVGVEEFCHYNYMGDYIHDHKYFTFLKSLNYFIYFLYT
jgi:hypothetical protein